jgi:hypothetical protein
MASYFDSFWRVGVCGGTEEDYIISASSRPTFTDLATSFDDDEVYTVTACGFVSTSSDESPIEVKREDHIISLLLLQLDAYS